MEKKKIPINLFSTLAFTNDIWLLDYGKIKIVHKLNNLTFLTPNYFSRTCSSEPHKKFLRVYCVYSNTGQ